MAAINSTWDASVPLGSENAKNGDDRIRELKLNLVERLRNGGQRMPITGATTNTDDGRHCCGESNSAGSSELAGEFTIYGANGTTPIAIVRDSNSAAAVVAENASGEFFTGALAIRSTGIVKGATVEVSTLLRPAATADNKVQDNAVDIGVDTTNRFRDLFLGRNAKIGGTLNVTGIATFTAAPVFSAGVSGVSSIGATALSGGTITCTTNAIYQGSQQTAVVNHATGAYTVLATDRMIFFPLTGTVTLVLPSASILTNIGRELWLNVTSALTATIVSIYPPPAGRPLTAMPT